MLITGGALRIGEAIALFFAQKKWNIGIHYNTSKKEALKLQKKILSFGVKCCIVKSDLSDDKNVAKLFSKIKKQLGKINCLINSASVFENDEVENINIKKWNLHFDVNLKAPALLSGEFAKQQNITKSNLINIVDQRVLKITPYFLSYTLSKIALNGLTKMLAMKLAPKIRVNAIAPGPVLKNKRQSENHFKKQYKNTILQQKVSTDDICKTIEFIINNQSITGLTIPVDSGQNLGWKTPDLINIKE